MKTPRLQYYDLGEGVTAFSTTRQGGYSQGNYGEFNINRYCGDSEEAIRQNRASLCQVLGIEDHRLLMPHQVHLTEMTVVDEAFLRLSSDEVQQRMEGVDAVMTNVLGVCIGVSTADCIPVLLYDGKHRASCAIHAGWRGTVKRIVEKAVAKMTEVYGSRPADILAQIGPGIHLESFEVGDEVFEAFAQEGFPMEAISRKYPITGVAAESDEQEKWHIDLPECNRLQLVTSGVSANQITVSPVCTFLQSESFFSARRLGINSGRIFTGILLR
jgi:YfiH family protein